MQLYCIQASIRTPKYPVIRPIVGIVTAIVSTDSQSEIKHRHMTLGGAVFDL